MIFNRSRIRPHTGMNGRQLKRVCIIILLLACAVGLWPRRVSAEKGFAERRRDQFGKNFSYFVYPIFGEIPGLGTAAGVGTSVLNMSGTDADFTGYWVEGDFKAAGLTLLDLHLLPKRLVFDVGYNDYLVAPLQYQRGMGSSPSNYIQPKAEGYYFISQLTLTFSERRFELYARHITGNQRLHEVLDSDGHAFGAVDTGRHEFHGNTLGFIVDLTDDRLDPRKGLRLEVARKMPDNNNRLRSDYHVMDYNLTGYLPAREWDTLALNFFFSKAYVLRQGVTDFSALQQEEGLGCAQRAPGPEQDQCQVTEADRIDAIIAQNRFGTASALGGTQRLRSYDNGRFYAGNALFYGIEYRWNLTNEFTPFDLFFAKGVRTGIQLAAFAEQGAVTDDLGRIWKNRRTSYGIGARLILSGVVIRADLADGDEGRQFQFFITYPWSMFSVDNP